MSSRWGRNPHKFSSREIEFFLGPQLMATLKILIFSTKVTSRWN